MTNQHILYTIASQLQLLGFRVEWVIKGTSFRCYSAHTDMGQAYTFKDTIKYSGPMIDLAEAILTLIAEG